MGVYWPLELIWAADPVIYIYIYIMIKRVKHSNYMDDDVMSRHLT
jgi:hypothetical protein